MMNLIATKTLTPADEARYLSDYLPLVNKVIKQFGWQTSSVMDKEDMRQIALMGLLSSLRRYGPPDAQFAGYAVQRIRGAVLDELRQQDWRPRRLRQQTHKLTDAIREITRELGYEPRFEELSKRLSVTAEAYQQYLLLNSASALESLDNLLESDVHTSALFSRPLEEELLPAYTLRSAVERLDKREQLILTLYYQHEMSLREIALVLGVSEARVCQLNKAIAQKIECFWRE
ncbi:FliA/WhiG family RNA polymerase sigma factor [Kosakonia sp. H02]|nr:FliA/WhiG family RNA polymerase sigma factor [Kosakonia sp. H02]